MRLCYWISAQRQSTKELRVCSGRQGGRACREERVSVTTTRVKVMNKGISRRKTERWQEPSWDDCIASSVTLQSLAACQWYRRLLALLWWYYVIQQYPRAWNADWWSSPRLLIICLLLLSLSGQFNSKVKNNALCCQIIRKWWNDVKGTIYL